jgi:hypothetical protein
MLQQELSSHSAVLHPIASAMVTQFPDPRLIQYDCGELLITKNAKSGAGKVLVLHCKPNKRSRNKTIHLYRSYVNL